MNDMILWPQIEQEYGIQISKWVKIRDVYRIITQNHDVLCLKSYSISLPEIRFISQVFNHLSEIGFKQSPKILLTLSEAAWITSEGTHYMLSNWIVGEQPDFHNKSHYKKAFRLLAKFHSAAEGLHCPDAPDERVKYNKLPEKITAYRDILYAYPESEHLHSTCIEALERLHLPAAIKAAEQEQAAAAFVHGDYNYPNLVLDSSRTMQMIDFENTSLNVRMQDLAHILHRNFPWQGVETLRWIEYYHRKRPLCTEDLSLLHTLLLVPYPVIRKIVSSRKLQLQPNKIVLPNARQVSDYVDALKLLP